MTSQEAIQHIETYLPEQFGRMVELREVALIRRVSGRVWRGRAVCVLEEGELDVGFVGVDEAGMLVEKVGVKDLVETIRARGEDEAKQEGAGAPRSPTPSMEEAMAWQADLAMEFGGEGFGDDEGPETQMEVEEIWEKVDELLAEATKESLVSARELLPRLLEDPDVRGAVLSQMAWVEYELGEEGLSLDYLEAAAREFADAADLQSLELLSRKVEEMLGEERFRESVFYRLLRETRGRMEPLQSLSQVPVLSGIEAETLEEVAAITERIVVPADTPLLKEGDPSLHVFFVKSGRLTVRVQAPDGSLKAIANLLSGDLIGETSVLSETAAHCNATVHAEVETELWKIEASKMRGLFESSSRLRSRVSQARELRRIHSFLSLHPDVGELEAVTREGLMGCIEGIIQKKAGQTLVEAGQLPPAAFIVVDGAVEQRIQGRTMRDRKSVV